MVDTWTVVAPTGAWDVFTFEQFAITTESGLVLRTESDLALISEYTTPTWTLQSNGSTTWVVQ